MNKNYKENNKNRNVKVEKPRRNLDIKEYRVTKSYELLKYLIEVLGYSRNNAKNLLSNKLIAIDGAPVSQFDFMVSPGDVLIISKKPIRPKAQKKLPIVYEDDDIIVINKPAGLLTIASDKEKSQTAYRLVMDYVRMENKRNRIFIVHRLDKETSGILMFVKNEQLRDALQENWNDTVIKRGYYAVCEGNFAKKEDTVINYLKMNSENLMYVTKSKKNSQKCITEYHVIKENSKYSLLDINLKTGRKNQIRVTLGDLGHYVLGDDKYGEPENPLKRLCLHAYELQFKNPLTKKTFKFKCPMPKEFSKLFND